MGTPLVELLLGTMSCASLVLAGCGTRSGGAPSEKSNPPLDSGASEASPDGAACPTACAFGCAPATTNCSEMVPASQAAEHLRAGDSFRCVQGPNPSSLPAIRVPASGTVTFDTNGQTITIEGSGQVFAPWGDPYTPDGSATPAAVVHIASLTLGAGANVRVTSTWPLPPTALILLVDGNVTAAGATQAVIDASGQSFARAGAMPGSVSAGGTATDDAGGGGGAGHASPGGAGGCWPDGGGGAAGAPSGVTLGREILQMGAGGGGPWGAPGGGALQITACGSIELGAGVVVNASGGGGGGGPGGQSELIGGPPGFGGGGGGGGSGGTILLEASSISVLGAIAANGGGGGGGGALGAPGANGAGGQSWDPTTSPSAIPSGGLGAGTGGPGGTGVGGNGGAGGAGNSPSGQPGLCSDGEDGAGGGGGSVGAIFLNVPAGAPAPKSGSASPPPKVSRTCTTAESTCNYP